jgi:hypothetical protein
MNIGPITNAVIDNIITELKKTDTREKLYLDVIEPVLCNISSRYYPYFLLIIILLITIIVLIIILLITIVTYSVKNRQMS